MACPSPLQEDPFSVEIPVFPAHMGFVRTLFCPYVYPVWTKPHFSCIIWISHPKGNDAVL